MSFKGRLETSLEEQNLQTPFSIPDKIWNQDLVESQTVCHLIVFQLVEPFGHNLDRNCESETLNLLSLPKP